MERMADQVVAQKYGDHIARRVYDRRLAVTFVGLVQHIVVNQSGLMHHLYDGRQRRVSARQLAGRLGT